MTLKLALLLNDPPRSRWQDQGRHCQHTQQTIVAIAAPCAGSLFMLFLHELDAADRFASICIYASKGVEPQSLHLACTIAALASESALAQQPIQPLPKVGGCPLGW